MSKKLSEEKVGEYAEILRKNGLNTEKLSWSELEAAAKAMHSLKVGGKQEQKVSKMKVSMREVYKCSRCKIDNIRNPDRTCPCPRGSCDAKVFGDEVTTKQVFLRE